MISTGVERRSGSHRIRTQNAVSANVFGINQFIGLESDPTGTSRAVKNGIISDLKKTLFGLTSIPPENLSKTSDHPCITTEHDCSSCDDLEALVTLLILQRNCSLTDLSACSTCT